MANYTKTPLTSFFFPVVFRKMEQIVTLRTGQVRKRLSILFYFTAILIQFSR